jgi:hypothetical protein
MLKLFPFILFIFVRVLSYSQETIINVSLSQPREIKINAGDDLSFSGNQSIILGNELTVTGGTPDFNFLWRDDLTLLGNTSTISVSQAGKYYVTVEDSKNCSDTDTVFVINTSVSNKEMTDISIYPNPVFDRLFLQADGNNPIYKIEILSVKGAQQLVYFVNQSIPSGSVSLDLSELHQGIYLLRIQTRKFEALKSFVKN